VRLEEGNWRRELEAEHADDDDDEKVAVGWGNEHSL
jgi:hypothetical protein